MPTIARRNSRREEIVAIDLGTSVVKAVHLRRKGTETALLNYVQLEVPPTDKGTPREHLSALFRRVLKALGSPTRRAVIALGSSKSLLTHLDLPSVTPSDLRRMIKLSPKSYLQRDLPDHLFDCYVAHGAADNSPSTATRFKRKSRVLVGGAPQANVEEISQSARDAGLILEAVTFSSVACVNAFKARKDDASDEVVALLDIGYSSSTINIVQGGDLLLTRFITFGAEKISDVLEKMSKPRSSEPTEEDTSFSDEAEMQSRLQRAILLLAREVDASMGFFVSQQEATVSRILVSGGSARSQFILQTLEAELALPCESWNPMSGLQLDLPEARRQEMDYEAPQYPVAVGAGLGVLRDDLIPLNLLAEEQETAEWRRRDPVRRATWGAAALVAILLAYAGFLGWQLWVLGVRQKSLEEQVRIYRTGPAQSVSDAAKLRDLENALAGLDKQSRNRSLWAPSLNALQFVAVPDIQVYRVKLEQSIVKPPPPPPPKPGSKTPPAKPKPTLENLMLTIQGKNYGDTKQIDDFIEKISREPYFAERLRTNLPVSLKDLQPRQVDPADPNRTFSLFTIECHFAERALNE